MVAKRQASLSGGLDPWIDGYLEYLRDVRRLGKRTLVDMRCTYKRVIASIGNDRPGVPLWKLSLEDYLRWIERERETGWSTKSIAKAISHLRGLLDYAWRSGRADRNVLDGFQLQDDGPDKAPEVLTVEEARKLLSVCGKRTSEERRERLMVLLLYGCGFRTFELCALDIRDVDKEEQEIVVRRGKGGMQRRVPVPDGVWPELLSYLLDRKGKRGALFRTLAMGKRIQPKEVCEVIAGVVTRAGLGRKVTAKTLRHSFATHLMDRGVDLAVIASLMGHRTPQETGVYLHVLPGQKEDAVRRLAEKRRTAE